MEEETNKRRWFRLVGNTGLQLRTRLYIPEDFELQLLKILLSHKVVFEGLRWNGYVVGAGTQGLVCWNRWVSCVEAFI
jgi:hypothetical protein